MLVFIASQSRYTKNKILDSFHYIGFFTSLETESFSKQYHKINFREKLWEASITKIKASPILGYGIGVERQLIAEELSNNQILSLDEQLEILQEKIRIKKLKTNRYSRREFDNDDFSNYSLSDNTGSL